jgi:hypothetical protein
MLTTIWGHNTYVSRATNSTLFKLFSGVEAVMLEEIKHESAQTMAEAIFYPTEAEDKDLLELDRLTTIDNLQKYQIETKALRDKKVKDKTFDIGHLVLLQSLHTESSDKL